MRSVSFLAGVVRKSKFGVVVGGAVGGALLALSIGAIFVYRNCRDHGAKHNDVFVDVAGTPPPFLFYRFPKEKKNLDPLLLTKLHGQGYMCWNPLPVR